MPQEMQGEKAAFRPCAYAEGALAHHGQTLVPGGDRRHLRLEGGGRCTVEPADYSYRQVQAAALDLRPELAEVIAVAEEAGTLRAIVSGSGPTIAALVEDPGSAQRVSRALKASGLVAEVLRADAPVAGARVVG